MACSTIAKKSTCLENELRVVLVGKTGAGKSATGNTIAGSAVFASKPMARSVTQTTDQYSLTRNAKKMQLIDVPGFCDTNMNEGQIKEEVIKCVLLSHPGLHAILFVVRIGRYTQEDMNTLDQFIRCFGEESMKFVIIILTGEDDLKEGQTTLEEYLEDSPEDFKKLLQYVKFRCLTVNNRGSEAEKDKFFTDLVSIIQDMVEDNGGSYYTHAMYTEVQSRLMKVQNEENKRIQALKKEEDLRRIQEFRTEIEEKLKNSNLREKELEKKLKQQEEIFKLQLEKEHQQEAIEETRRKIAQVGGIIGMVGGGILAFIGNESFEFIGGAIGTALAGPVGAIVGGVIGGVIGTFVASYAAKRIGERLAIKFVNKD